jgi:hypothetical protein
MSEEIILKGKYAVVSWKTNSRDITLTNRRLILEKKAEYPLGEIKEAYSKDGWLDSVLVVRLINEEEVRIGLIAKNGSYSKRTRKFLSHSWANAINRTIRARKQVKNKIVKTNKATFVNDILGCKKHNGKHPFKMNRHGQKDPNYYTWETSCGEVLTANESSLQVQQKLGIGTDKVKDKQPETFWLCIYCGALNKTKDTKCFNCGAPRKG